MNIVIGGLSMNNAPSWGVSSAIFDIPTRRGGNFYVSHAPKRLWLPKPVDERIFKLEMWVSGSTVGEYSSNLNTLLTKFHHPYELVVERDGLVGLCQMQDDISQKPIGRNACKLTANFKMKDPYFYAVAASQFELTGTGDLEILNDGVEVDCIIEIVGDITNPVVYNAGREFSYDGTISTTNFLHVNTADFSATRGTANAISGISHTGDYRFLSILPGLQTITLSGTVGATTPVMTVTFTKGYV